mgnify:CR=1 FL=1
MRTGRTQRRSRKTALYAKYGEPRRLQGRGRGVLQKEDPENMRILALASSCGGTAAAVVEDGRTDLS